LTLNKTLINLIHKFIQPNYFKRLLLIQTTDLIQANFSVCDLEDGVAELLVLLNGLINILALIRQLDSGHRHDEVFLIKTFSFA